MNSNFEARDSNDLFTWLHSCFISIFSAYYKCFYFIRFSIICLFVICLIEVFYRENRVEAATKPKWEMGLGYFDYQTPHYLGSNHSYHFNIPVPRLIYRMDNIELSRESRFYLFDSDNFQIDVAMSGRVPVFSDDEDEEAPDGADDPDNVIIRTTNYTRRGMPDLPVTVFAGIQFRLYLTDHLILEVPYFHGVKLESGFGHAGNVGGVELRLEMFDRDSDHHFSLIAENLYAGETYNDFYYQVTESEVLPGRPQFDAKAGLVASSYGISFLFQCTDRLSVSGSYYVHNMKQSVVRDSPLVMSKVSSQFSLLISYSFFLSDKTVKIP